MPARTRDRKESHCRGEQRRRCEEFGCVGIIDDVDGEKLDNDDDNDNDVDVDTSFSSSSSAAEEGGQAREARPESSSSSRASEGERNEWF